MEANSNEPKNRSQPSSDHDYNHRHKRTFYNNKQNVVSTWIQNYKYVEINQRGGHGYTHTTTSSWSAKAHQDPDDSADQTTRSSNKPGKIEKKTRSLSTNTNATNQTIMEGGGNAIIEEGVRKNQGHRKSAGDDYNFLIIFFFKLKLISEKIQVIRCQLEKVSIMMKVNHTNYSNMSKYYITSN
jgi:hypothetical protein